MRAAGFAFVLLLLCVLMGCGARASDGSAARPTPQATQSLTSLLGCLRTAGADPSDVTANRDLRVSVGELGMSFASFNAYVGVAVDRREAVAAAQDLDRQVALLRQAGHGVVRGDAVFYFDAPLVPRAATHLVEACLAGSAGRASAAMAALAAALPQPQYPVTIARRLVARCRALTGAAGCECVFGRAARLFAYGQIDGLGRAWAPKRARSVFAGLLGTCEPATAVARL